MTAVEPAWSISAFQFTPSCLIAWRSISTMRTFSITWSLPAMLSMFSTSSGLATVALAICTARSASPAFSTVPDRITLSLIPSTRTDEPGMTRLMVSASAEVFWSTRMLSESSLRPAASKNMASVTPLFRPST